MGNELRVDSINTAQKRELAQKSYDTVRGSSRDISTVWEEQFSPMAMGGALVFPLLFNRKEFKSVAMNSALAGKELIANTNNMRQLNEIAHLTTNLKLPNAVVNGVKVVDPFLQADLISLQTKINNARNSGALSKDLLKSLNKEYASLIDKSSSWKTSFIQKGLAKTANVSPGLGADILRTYKSFKGMMIFNELLQEAGPIFSTFKMPKENKSDNVYSLAKAEEGSSINWEAGFKQIGKSIPRMAVGGTGFILGATAGSKIGGIVGSALGSLIPIPGAGTMVGGILGSALGYAVGAIGSSMVRNIYNKIVPSDVAKDDTIAKILDENDKSATTKILLEQEINEHQKYLTTAYSIAQQAQAEQDNDTLKTTQEKIADVEANYNTLVEVYQKKFGPITQASGATGTSEAPATNQVASGTTNTTGTGATATEASNTTAIANAAITNPQTAWNNPAMYNQAMMNSMPTTDWSAMLPLNMQKQYFGATA